VKCLMLGAGHTPLERKLSVTEEPVDEWVSLDVNEDACPNIVFDLGLIEKGHFIPQSLPWERMPEESFDEIHAYDVLEHFGQQGNYQGFFCGFRELWRILKPGGYLLGICPRYDNEWAWGDPGHTRVVTANTLSYLTKWRYKELGTNPATDYRRFVDPCWWEVAAQEYTEHGLRFALRKVQ